MIKIIGGVYGHYNGSSVEPKDKNSAPFELTPEQEAQLVEQGVAVYVDDGRTALPEGVEGIPQYDENTSVNDLREIGKVLGLTFKVGMKKVDIIAALDAYIAEHSADDGENDGENDEGKSGSGSGEGNEPPSGANNEGGEAPPAFNPAEAVQ